MKQWINTQLISGSRPGAAFRQSVPVARRFQIGGVPAVTVGQGRLAVWNWNETECVRCRWWPCRCTNRRASASPCNDRGASQYGKRRRSRATSGA